MSWIKLVCHLHETVEVMRLSASTGIDSFGVVGRLHRVWSWVGENTTDGKLLGLTAAAVDGIAETPGFGAAMVAVGWLAEDGNTLIVPKFDRHNDDGAKKRAQAAERQRRFREKNTPPKARRKPKPAPQPEPAPEPPPRILPTLPPERPMPKQDFRAESRQIVDAYAKSTGCYQSEGPAIDAVELLLRSEEIAVADLLAKVQAIGTEIARLPWKEKRYSVSPTRFFKEERWRADPKTFSAGRTDEDEAPKREAWQIREELKALDAEIKSVRDALSSWTVRDIYPDPEVPHYRESKRTMTPSAQARIESLTAKRQALKAELANAK